jgi:hypothetical protein
MKTTGLGLLLFALLVGCHAPPRRDLQMSFGDLQSIDLQAEGIVVGSVLIEVDEQDKRALATPLPGAAGRVYRLRVFGLDPDFRGSYFIDARAEEEASFVELAGVSAAPHPDPGRSARARRGAAP